MILNIGKNLLFISDHQSNNDDKELIFLLFFGISMIVVSAFVCVIICMLIAGSLGFLFALGITSLATIRTLYTGSVSKGVELTVILSCALFTAITAGLSAYFMNAFLHWSSQTTAISIGLIAGLCGGLLAGLLVNRLWKYFISQLRK